MLPAFTRLPKVFDRIKNEEYFVLHAPRQSGKTTSIKALSREINADGKYYALYCSLETLKGVDDRKSAMIDLVDKIKEALDRSPVNELKSIRVDMEGKGFSLYASSALNQICKALDKPIVVFFDEVDTLSGEIIVSFLSQLRDGFIDRSESFLFPRSIALVSMRSIRDYVIQTRPEEESIGSGSPFNIAEPLTLSDFTQNEIKTLYEQHTRATGQIFEPEAIERAWYWTEGQPWLVNALAKEVTETILEFDFSQTATKNHFDTAADNIMKRRGTHIDSLLKRLSEPRVRRFIEPMLAASEDFASLGSAGTDNGASLNNDLQYCVDLGLVKDVDNSLLRPANPIYSSVIIRFLNQNIQKRLPQNLTGQWIDGQSIDMNGLLKAFQDFWSLKSEKYLKGLLYHEAGPHILLSAFLQRVVNGGAMITEEFADGLGYVDINVQYSGRHYPIELKIKDNHRLAASLDQIIRYMDGCRSNEGWLVIFDRTTVKTSSSKKPDDPEKTITWMKKIFWETKTVADGMTVHIVGC
jgi:hypothetical protein